MQMKAKNGPYILHGQARIPSVYNVYIRADMYGDLYLSCVHVCLCVSIHALNWIMPILLGSRYLFKYSSQVITVTLT